MSDTEQPTATEYPPADLTGIDFFNYARAGGFPFLVSKSAEDFVRAALIYRHAEGAFDSAKAALEHAEYNLEIAERDFRSALAKGV